MNRLQWGGVEEGYCSIELFFNSFVLPSAPFKVLDKQNTAIAAILVACTITAALIPNINADLCDDKS